MKTKEELSALKEEVKNLNRKLSELTEDELKLVTGGVIGPFTQPLSLGNGKLRPGCKPESTGTQYDINIYNGNEIKDFEPNIK